MLLFVSEALGAMMIGATVVIVGILAAVTHYFSAHQRTLRTLRAAEVVPIDAAVGGRVVRVVGKLLPRDELLVGPLSGRRCAHYVATVEEYVSSGKSGSWVERTRQVASRDFIVEDTTGRAIVRVGATVVSAIVRDHSTSSGTFDDANEIELAFLDAHGLAATGTFGWNRALRYQEGVLEPGEQVAVLGRARWEDDPDAGALVAGASYRDAARRQRLVIEPTPDGPLYVSDDPAALGR